MKATVIRVGKGKQEIEFSANDTIFDALSRAGISYSNATVKLLTISGEETCTEDTSCDEDGVTITVAPRVSGA